MRIKTIHFFGIFMGILLPLQAGQKTLTLEEAIARALESNPEILLAERELEAIRGKKLESKAPANPELVFSQEGLPTGPNKGEREVTLGVGQLIEFPGKRALRIEAIASEEEAMVAEIQSLRLLVTAEVKQAYFKVAHSQMLIVRIKELLDVLEQCQETARIRFQAGQVSSIDVLRYRLESLRVRSELIEAERRHQENLAALDLTMGKSVEEPYAVSPALDFTPLQKDLSILRQEVEARPSLRAALHRLEQSRRGLSLAQKSRLPDLTLGFYYPSLRTSSWGFSLGLSIPLWRDRWKGQVLQAEMAAAAAATAVNARRQKILTLLEAAYADVRAAEERLALFETSLLGEVETMLELGISQYQYGQIDSLNLFDIYKTYKSTKLEHLDALLAHKIALSQLEIVGEK